MDDLNLAFATNGADIATELFSALTSSNGSENRVNSENIFFSPLAIQSCMALVFAGARGETGKEIVRHMKLVSDYPLQVAETFHFVLEKYKRNTYFKFANKVYVNSNKQLKTHYQETLRKFYFAESELLNFAESPPAANIINAWVESKTVGKVRGFVTPAWVNNNTHLVFLSVAHFKSEWSHKFEKARTMQGDFTVKENVVVKIPYIQKTSTFNYCNLKNLDCTAVELPCKDTDISMIILLPNKWANITTLGELFSKIKLTKVSSSMHKEIVSLKIPKFKQEFLFELADALKKLGLQHMFSENADFSNMVESPDNISSCKIWNKFSVEINEDGEKLIDKQVPSLLQRKPTLFHANRPFLYIIWNKKNVLFVGAFLNAPPPAPPPRSSLSSRNSYLLKGSYGSYSSGSRS